MNFNLHWITKGLCEVSVDEIKTGTMDAKEAKEMAIKLMALASDLLSVEDKL